MLVPLIDKQPYESLSPLRGSLCNLKIIMSLPFFATLVAD
jgi:hypothetical protein